MGHWGIRPLENDEAADWGDRFLRETQIVAKLSDAIEHPVTEIATVRAAAHTLLAIADAGVVDKRSIDDLAHRAILRLSEGLESDEYSNPDIRRAIVGEIVKLRSLVSAVAETVYEPDPIAHELNRVAQEQFNLRQYNVVDVESSESSIAKDVVGTGFLDERGVLHIRLDDGRPDGLSMTFRCVPSRPATD